jgi:hypothetical protein
LAAKPDVEASAQLQQPTALTSEIIGVYHVLTTDELENIQIW